MALDQVMIALKKLIGSIAGIGMPAGTEQISAEKRDLNWKKEHGSALLQIFSQEDLDNFVQVATEADQQGLGKLLALLEQLRRATQKSLADDDLMEQKSARNHKKLKEQLQVDIDKLDRTLDKQKKNLSAYKSLRNELKVDITLKTTIKKKSEEYLKQQIEARRQEKLKYESDKRERSREKAVILKLQKIVDERLAKLSAVLRKRVDQ